MTDDDDTGEMVPLPEPAGNPLFVIEGGKHYPIDPDGFLMQEKKELADVPSIVDPEGGES